MMDFYYQQGKKIKDEDPKAYMFYWHGIAAMQYACAINDFITANLLVKSMLEVYNNSLTISPYNKSLLLRMLYSTNSKEEIENFNALENIIIKMESE